MEKTKVALLGRRGHWGYALKGLKDLADEVEVVGISTGCEDDPAAMAEIVKDFLGIEPKIYEDYKVMLDEAGADVVVIDGPYHRHAEMCIEALKRNLHVFCEKPIALELDDLEAIRAAYKAAKPGTELISMVGLRAERAFATAYKAVQDGVIGKVKMVNARKSYKLGKRPAFYSDRATYGGTIPWVGSHALDWIRWFGGAPFEKVYAFSNSDDNHDNGTMEMTATCCFELANKVVASASIDFLRPATAPTHGDDRVRVAGTEGVIEVTYGVVTLINADGVKELELLPERGIFYDFIRHLRYGEAAYTNAEETFELTRACLVTRNCADQASL